MTLRDWLLLLGMLLAFGAASATEPRPEPASSHTTASWYCSATSPCTAGYGPSDLVAAIDPTTGYEKGERVTVWHGDRSVSVLLVDICQCPGARVIDLTSGAFSRLAPLSAGVIRVVLVPGRVSPTLPPTDTAP